MEWLKSMPQWVGAVGWAAVLIGFLFQRRAIHNIGNQRNTGLNIGSANQIHQSNEGASQPPKSGDSALSQWGSWAYVIGLGLSLLPLLKDYLAK